MFQIRNFDQQAANTMMKLGNHTRSIHLSEFIERALNPPNALLAYISTISSSAALLDHPLHNLPFLSSLLPLARFSRSRRSRLINSYLISKRGQRSPLLRTLEVAARYREAYSPQIQAGGEQRGLRYILHIINNNCLRTAFLFSPPLLFPLVANLST